MGHGAAAAPRPRLPRCTASLVPIGVLTAASWVGTAHAPALATTQPLALMALSPRLAFLLVAAAAVPAPAFFAVGLARLVAADPSHYVIGRHGYDLVAERIDRRPPARRLVERARAAVRSGGLVVVALRPSGHVLCAAGAAGLRPLPVAVADVAGTAAWLGAVWLAAPSLPEHATEWPVRLAPVGAAIAAAAALGAVAARVVRARSAGRAQPGAERAGAARPTPAGVPPAGRAVTSPRRHPRAPS